MKKLMEGWKRFLNEDLLAEGRLDDAKEKYPDEAEYIDAMSAKDPSGNNKYLMWMAKQFNADASNFSMSDAGKKIFVDILTELIQSFHKNAQRLEKKDINQYKTLDDLNDTLEDLGPSNKQKREKNKEVAQEGSSIVYESDKYLVVRPDTEEASCYYGRNTRWCISATESANYYEDYTQRGKVFYMILDNDASDKDPNKKLALTYDASESYGYDRQPDQVFDATDYSFPVSKLKGILGDEYSNILVATQSDLEKLIELDEARIK